MRTDEDTFYFCLWFKCHQLLCHSYSCIDSLSASSGHRFVREGETEKRLLSQCEASSSRWKHYKSLLRRSTSTSCSDVDRETPITTGGSTLDNLFFIFDSFCSSSLKRRRRRSEPEFSEEEEEEETGQE